MLNKTESFNFNLIIQDLLKERKVFHSEDDLKLAMSLVIYKRYPQYQIRLERPVGLTMVNRNDEKVEIRAPIDIFLITPAGKEIVIELKYKTKRIKDIEINEETFSLANHGAALVGRFSFRKDIYRIENYLSNSKKCSKGYVFILTNDMTYPDKDLSEENNLDKNYSFHHNAIIKAKDDGWCYEKIDNEKYTFNEKDKQWISKLDDKPHWTSQKDYVYQLQLMSDYKVAWERYSKVENQEFKYCLIEVKE